MAEQAIEEQDFDIEIMGGITADVFPKVEKFLYDSQFHRSAILFVLSKPILTKYNALIDAVTCEVFTEFKPWCAMYYRGQGPHIAKIVSDDVLLKMEDVLLKSLAFAVVVEQASLLNERVPVSWRSFVRQMKSKVIGKSSRKLAPRL
jgi:hypothetical protein